MDARGESKSFGMTVKEYIEENPLRPFYAERGTVHNYTARIGKMNATHIRPSLFVRWDSAADLIEYCDGFPGNIIEADPHSGLMNKNFSNGSQNEWRNGEHLTYDRAQEFLSDGKATDKQKKYYDTYRENILKKRPDLADIEASAVVSKKRKVFSESGDDLDIDRYMNGEVEQWTRRATSKIRKRSAKIFVAMPQSGGNDAENFSRAAAFVVAVSNIIELAGISTEIEFGNIGVNATNTESFHCYSVIAKRVEEPLDIERLLSFGGAALLRNYIFIATSHVNQEEFFLNTDSGKGMSIDKIATDTFIAPAIDADIFIHADDVFIQQFETSKEFEIIINQVKSTLGHEI